MICVTCMQIQNNVFCWNQIIFANSQKVTPVQDHCIIYCFNQISMEARAINHRSSRLASNQQEQGYNNIIQIGQPRDTQESQYLSGRLQLDIYYQVSTNESNESDMDPQIALAFERIKRELQGINNKLKKLDTLQERVEKLQGIIIGLTKTQNSPARSKKNQVERSMEEVRQIRVPKPQLEKNAESENKILKRLIDKRKVVIEPGQLFSGQFRKIQIQEKSVLLANQKDLCKYIKKFISKGFARLLMVRIYIFMEKNLGVNQDQELILDLIRIKYRDNQIVNEREEAQLLKQYGDFKMQSCKKRINLAEQMLQTHKNSLQLTYDFQDWVKILQSEISVNLSLKINKGDERVFENMIMVALSDQKVFSKCKIIGKFTQILCLVKYIFFPSSQRAIKAETLLTKLRLTKDQRQIAALIISESYEYIK